MQMEKSPEQQWIININLRIQTVTTSGEMGPENASISVPQECE